MLAISLALAASVAWGFADFFGGILTRRHRVVVVMLVSQAIGWLVITVVALAGQSFPADWADLWPAAFAGLAGAIGLAAFYRGLSVGLMSIVAPLSALSVTIPVAYGLTIGNRPTILQGIGIVFAVTGTLLAAREKEASRKAAVKAGVILALISACGFGLFFVGMDMASTGSNYLWAPFVSRAVGIPAIALVALVQRAPFTMTRHDLHLVVALGLLDAAAQCLFAFASTEGIISLVAVLSALYPVVVILLAWGFLKERLERHQLFGVTAALVGVSLITGFGT